jgi:peptide/nickel transport system permease protein
LGVKQYILKRLLLIIPIFFVVSSITFVVVRIIPANPLIIWVGPKATAEQIARARIELGLDKPLYEQYFIYVAGIFRGNFGVSFISHRPVIVDLTVFIPASLELIIAAMIIGVIIGFPLGVISAKKKDKIEDHLSRLTAIAGVSLPTFFIGMLLQLLFFRYIGLLPAGGRLSASIEASYPVTRITGFYLIDSLVTGNLVAFQDTLVHMILPAFTLALYPIGLVVRMTRTCMLEVLSEDYIKAARAHGIPERTILYTYALKNAVIPSLTTLVLSFGYSLTGTFLVELIFNWPGLGLYTSQAILAMDYAAIAGVTLLVTLFYVIANLSVDVIQAYLDPRVVLK